MNTMTTIACGLAASLVAAGCAQDEVLPHSVTQEFERAFNQDDVEATAALFSADAQILPQDGPVVAGREAIKQFLTDQVTPVIAFNAETDMSLVRGDIAIEQGHYTVRDVRRGSDIEEGKYMHIWRKEGGDWKIYRIIFNTDVARPAAVSVSSAEGS